MAFGQWTLEPSSKVSLEKSKIKTDVYAMLMLEFDSEKQSCKAYNLKQKIIEVWFHLRASNFFLIHKDTVISAYSKVTYSLKLLWYKIQMVDELMM